jgi:hypothetical protein
MKENALATLTAPEAKRPARFKANDSLLEFLATL